MSDPWVIVGVTVGLIALSAFFVAVEFALIAARRHRLEDEAATSRSARAALRSASELSVLLAGSQLGITVCTLALGAITKPAVHHWLTPMLEKLGGPAWVADAGGFVLALIIVTFLHLVVGEMAPKSWAIAHPERAAKVLALPMRGFMWLTRPLIIQLNNLANWCLRRVGVEPVDQKSTGQDSDALRHLVEHSVDVGALDARYSDQLHRALELSALTLGDVLRPGAEVSVVRLDADVAEMHEVSRSSGHLRLPVRAGGDGLGFAGVVHIRDSLAAPPTATAADIMRPLLSLDAAVPVYEALASMRDRRAHLTLVTQGDRPIGLITISDVLQRLLVVSE